MTIKAILVLVSLLAVIISALKLKESNKLQKRNNDVYKFITYINHHLCSPYNKRRIMSGDTNWSYAQDWFLGKYKYNDFVYSDKPLILKEWWTKEEIEKLNS